MLLVNNRNRQGIQEEFRGLLKADAVLAEIRFRLSWVPIKSVSQLSPYLELLSTNLPR
jgi:hypothetical protein